MSVKSKNGCFVVWVLVVLVVLFVMIVLMGLVCLVEGFLFGCNFQGVLVLVGGIVIVVLMYSGV